VSALAALAALALADHVPGGLILGVALVAAGAIPSARRRNRHPLARVAMLAPGAWVVAAHAGVAGERWVRLLVFAATAVGGPLVVELDRRVARRGIGPLMFAVSVAGVYATVPDTEEALVLLGVAAPVTLLGLTRGIPLGRGAPAAVAVLAWTTAVGGVGRPASIVGGAGCLGAFLLAPLIPAARDRPTALALPALHVVLVAIAARVAGLRSTPRAAAFVVLFELAVAAAGCRLVARRP
jgi:hypothetical protein